MPHNRPRHCSFFGGQYMASLIRSFNAFFNFYLLDFLNSRITLFFNIFSSHCKLFFFTQCISPSPYSFHNHSSSILIFIKISYCPFVSLSPIHYIFYLQHNQKKINTLSIFGFFLVTFDGFHIAFITFFFCLLMIFCFGNC